MAPKTKPANAENSPFGDNSNIPPELLAMLQEIDLANIGEDEDDHEHGPNCGHHHH